MAEYYVLRDKKALAVSDARKWSREFGDMDRRVAETIFENIEPYITKQHNERLRLNASLRKQGLFMSINDDNHRYNERSRFEKIRVSTVFLGLNHQWGDGPPLIFETLVFNGPLDDEMRRYTTWEQAEAGHAEVVELVRAALARELAGQRVETT